ncbi:MAG: four helix bundle protein [Clostridia bacterium]|nr:four helix bundle protein [Clostridia bacterium]
MADSILRKKSKQFARDIVFLCRSLKQRGSEGALTSQLLRSGTSIGANIHEAQYAHGPKDFISKLEIALKECGETEYWLELLRDVGSLSESELQAYSDACLELRRMLVSSVTTLKNKI